MIGERLHHLRLVIMAHDGGRLFDVLLGLIKRNRWRVGRIDIDLKVGITDMIKSPQFLHVGDIFAHDRCQIVHNHVDLAVEHGPTDFLIGQQIIDDGIIAAHGGSDFSRVTCAR